MTCQHHPESLRSNSHLNPATIKLLMIFGLCSSSWEVHEYHSEENSYKFLWKINSSLLVDY